VLRNNSFCSEIYIKHIHAFYGQNVEYVNVKPGGNVITRL